ncbi:hypothetical protein BH11PAT4_BH11PAT4_3930 [soil metagenome]
MITFLTHLHSWFYRPISTKVAAIFRIATGTVLFLSFLLSAPYIRQFFSSGGYVSKEFVSRVANPNTLSLFYYLDAYWFVLGAFIVMMASILLYTFGIAARLNALVIYVLSLSFYNRFPLISFDGNALMIMMFLFATFLNSDRAYSPAWWQVRRDAMNVAFAKTTLGRFIEKHLMLPQPEKTGTVAGWSARLIQLNFAFVYLFAAFSKIRADAWFVQGTEAGKVLNFEYATANFTWLSSYPLIMACMTWGSMLLELGFPFLIWFKETRRFALFGLIVIHGSSMLTLNVSYFAETMLALGTIFLIDEDLTVTKKYFKKAQQNISLPWTRRKA